MIILIPPSEAKTTGGTGKPIHPNKFTKEILNRIKSYDADLSKLYGVKKEASLEAHTKNTSLETSPTMPAIHRYSGVVYKAIDYETMTPAGKKWLDEHVRIISALFGLVEPQHAIPDYKLKIDKLKLQDYWKPILSTLIDDEYVIDLLPQAHRSALEYKSGKPVEFVIYHDGEKRQAGHAGKHIKGRFIRWLCENRVTKPTQFSKFNEDGFRWNGNEFIKHSQ